jgi:hypothetical protein
MARTSFSSIFVGAFIGGIIGSLLTYFYVPSPQSEVPEAAAPPVTQEITSVEKITANYDTNEVRADAEFKGKWLHIQGLVGAIKVLSGPVVELLPLTTVLPPSGNEKTVEPIFLTTDKTPNPMTALSPGDKLDAWCQGNGTLGVPVFDHCRFYINGQPI